MGFLYPKKYMITVKEAFQKCNKKLLIEEYKKLLPEDFNLEEEGKCAEKWLEETLKIESIPSDTILSSYMVKDSFNNDEEYLDSCSIKENDLIEANLSNCNISEEEVNKLSAEECKNLIHTFRYPQNYAFEFSPWEEILGYKISQASIEMYGLEVILAGVVNEMTFFGYNEEKKDEEKSELERRVEECQEMLKQPQEVQDQYFKKVDDIFADFKDERTKEEKEKDDLDMWHSSCISSLRFLKLMRKIKEEIEEEKKND